MLRADIHVAVRNRGHSHRRKCCIMTKCSESIYGKRVFSLSPREHTTRCSLKIVRAGISALFVDVVPTPIQYTLSTPRNSTAGLQDRTHAISNQAVSTLGT